MVATDQKHTTPVMAGVPINADRRRVRTRRADRFLTHLVPAPYVRPFFDLSSYTIFS